MSLIVSNVELDNVYDELENANSELSEANDEVENTKTEIARLDLENKKFKADSQNKPISKEKSTRQKHIDMLDYLDERSRTRVIHIEHTKSSINWIRSIGGGFDNERNDGYGSGDNRSYNRYKGHIPLWQKQQKKNSMK